MRGQHLELKIDQRLQQARFDMAARAGHAAPHQCGKDPLRGGGARQHVGDRQAEGHRTLVLVAVQPHHAGTGLRQQILPGPLDPGAFLAIAADRGIDQARIDLAHRLKIEAQPLDDAGPKILDQHVGLGQQAAQRRKVGHVLEVDGKTFLGPVDGMEDGGIAADLGVAEIKPARQVTAIRPLDLDDAGAEVEQPQRAVGSGQELAHVDDDEPGQRQFGSGGHRLFLRLPGEIGRIAVLHRLQVLAIKHKLSPSVSAKIWSCT